MNQKSDIDIIYESFDKMDAILVNGKMEGNKISHYYLYIDESGEKRFALNDDKNYTIKKFNFNNPSNFGFYIWGGLASKEQIELKALNLSNELKSCDFKMNFIEMISDTTTQTIINSFSENVYIIICIQDILLWIFEDWIDQIKSKFPADPILHMKINSICLNFLKSIGIDNVKSIIDKNSTKILFLKFCEWLENKEPIDFCEQYIFSTIKNKCNTIYCSFDEVKFEFDYILFTIHKIWTYKNSTILCDEDQKLEKLLTKSRLVNNVSFINSKESDTIQLADFCIGLVRRFFEFIDNSSFSEIEDTIFLFDENSKNTYNKFISILRNSIDQEQTFINYLIDYDTFLKYKKLVFDK